MRRRTRHEAAPQAGAALATILIFVAAVAILAAAAGVVALSVVRTAAAGLRAEDDRRRAASAVEAAIARLEDEPAWRPAGPVVIAYDGAGAALEADVTVAVETPPARLVVTGRAGDAVVEARALVDAPVLLALRAETEARWETAVEVAGPAAAAPVVVAPGAEPPATVDLVVEADDAPGTRPVPIEAMTAAAARTLTEAVHDSRTFVDEVVVLAHEDVDETTPFVLRDCVLDGASVLALGDLVVEGGLAAAPREGFPLVAATGSITFAPGALDRRTAGVIVAGGSISIDGPLENRGLVQAANLTARGGDGAEVHIEDDAGDWAVGFEARVRRAGWRGP